jgi:hypothetical protein
MVKFGYGVFIQKILQINYYPVFSLIQLLISKHVSVIQHFFIPVTVKLEIHYDKLLLVCPRSP